MSHITAKDLRTSYTIKKIKVTCEQEMSQRYSSWWKGGVNDKHQRNWSFWTTFRWLKLSVMFLNGISPFKYLVVVSGQKALKEHCGENQRSKARVSSPRHVTTNVYDPRNLTLRTGRWERRKEGRQVGGKQGTRDKRTPQQVYDRVTQIAHANVCCVLGFCN